MFQLLDFYSNELQPSVSKHGKKNQNNQNDSGLQGIRSLVTHMGPPDHMKGDWYPGMTGATARNNYEMAHCMGYC